LERIRSLTVIGAQVRPLAAGSHILYVAARQSILPLK